LGTQKAQNQHKKHKENPWLVCAFCVSSFALFVFLRLPVFLT